MTRQLKRSEIHRRSHAKAGESRTNELQPHVERPYLKVQPVHERILCPITPTNLWCPSGWRFHGLETGQHGTPCAHQQWWSWGLNPQTLCRTCPSLAIKDSGTTTHITCGGGRLRTVTSATVHLSEGTTRESACRRSEALQVRVGGADAKRVNTCSLRRGLTRGSTAPARWCGRAVG